MLQNKKKSQPVLSCKTWTTLLFFVLFAGLQNLHAQRTIVVESDDFPSVGALNHAIEGDTLENGDRVDPNTIYVLKRDATYWTDASIVNDGYHLTIIAEEGGGHPPIIRPASDATGSSSRIFTTEGDITLKGLYISHLTDMGDTQQNVIRSVADHARIVIDNCWMEFDRQSFVRTNGDRNSVFITNSQMRNSGRNDISGNGRIIDTRSTNLDTLFMENNSFYNLLAVGIRSEGGPMKYVVSNHNTWVDMGEWFQLHAAIELHWTNNLIINAGWRGIALNTEMVPGETVIEPNNSGVISIRSMDDYEGISDQDRTLVVSYNNLNHSWQEEIFDDGTEHGRPLLFPFHDKIQAVYDSANDPLVVMNPALGDSITMDMWRRGLIQFENNIWEKEEDLQFADRPDIDVVAAFLEAIRLHPDKPEEFPMLFDRPITDPTKFIEGASLADWRDFTYSRDAVSFTAGQGGYPLGDLNWFPDLKEKWEAGVELTSVREPEAIAESFKLIGNYPNPFNPTTNIVYSLDIQAEITMNVFNILGQNVATIDLGIQTPGRHEFSFDASHLSSGIYLLRMQAGNQASNHYITLIK